MASRGRLGLMVFGTLAGLVLQACIVVPVETRPRSRYVRLGCTYDARTGRAYVP